MTHELFKDPAVPVDVKRLIQRHVQETLQLKQAQEMAQMLQQGSRGGPPQGQQAPNAMQGQGAPQPNAGGPPQPQGATSPQAGMVGPRG